MTDKVGINHRGFCIVAHTSRSDDMTRTFVFLLVLNLSGPNVTKNLRVSRLCGVQAFLYVLIDSPSSPRNFVRSVFTTPVLGELWPDGQPKEQIDPDGQRKRQDNKEQICPTDG